MYTALYLCCVVTVFLVAQILVLLWRHSNETPACEQAVSTPCRETAPAASEVVEDPKPRSACRRPIIMKGAHDPQSWRANTSSQGQRKAQFKQLHKTLTFQQKTKFISAHFFLQLHQTVTEVMKKPLTITKNLTTNWDQQVIQNEFYTLNQSDIFNIPRKFNRVDLRHGN